MYLDTVSPQEMLDYFHTRPAQEMYAVQNFTTELTRGKSYLIRPVPYDGIKCERNEIVTLKNDQGRWVVFHKFYFQEKPIVRVKAIYRG